jgi:hypothetical protein
MASAETNQSICRNPPGRLQVSEAGRKRGRRNLTEAENMAWVWLNIPLGALIFLAVAGIPMWLVIKRPDAGPASADQRRGAYGRGPSTAYPAVDPQQGRTSASPPSGARSGRRGLVGAR